MQVLQRLKARILPVFKSYRIAIPVNALFAVVCTVISALHISGIWVLGDVLNDFSQYYYTSQVLVQDPIMIYDQQYLMDTFRVYPFRYFPTILLWMFYPLTIFPLPVAFGVFSALSFAANLANLWLAHEILLKLGKKTQNTLVESCAAVFLILPFFIDYYVQGQISTFLALALLLSFYFLLNGREAIGGMFLGLSLAMKPITFFQIFFVLLIPFLAKDVKQLLKRAIFVVIPLLPDVGWFLLVPGLFQGFFRLNFVEFERTSASVSVSFSNFFVSILHFPSNYVTIACLAVSVAVGAYVIWKLEKPEDKLAWAFVFGIMAYFFTQIDVWSNQLPVLFPFLLIAAGYFEGTPQQKPFFTLYLLYPLLAEGFVVLYFNEALIVYFIPFVSFSFLCLIVIVVYRFLPWIEKRGDAKPAVKM